MPCSRTSVDIGAARLSAKKSGLNSVHDLQGSHGKSWEILKFETVMDFCPFSRSHEKLIFKGNVMEKSWNVCRNHQVHISYKAMSVF